MEKYRVEQYEDDPRIFLWHFKEIKYTWDELEEFHRRQQEIELLDDWVVIGMFNDTAAPSYGDMVGFVKYMWTASQYAKVPFGIIVSPLNEYARTALDIVNSPYWSATGRLIFVDTVEIAVRKAKEYLDC
jgi:hypothetical protein